MNDDVEERKDCQNSDNSGYKCDRPRGRVHQPDEIYASLAAKLCTVKDV